MTAFGIDVREVTPEYNTLLPRDAGREVDTGRELKLQSITARVKLDWDRNGDHYSGTYDVQFTVDHDEGAVRAASAGDAFGDLETVDFERLGVASAAAEQAVAGFLVSAGLTDYDIVSATSQLQAARDDSDVVTLHTDLEVRDDGN